MMNKYKDAISKIEASEELKNKIIEKMEKEKIRRSESIIMKIRKVITAIVSILGIVACSGFAYAAISGKISFGDQGIIFSEEYSKYEEKVENQILEKDGTKLELVSKMCDDGFLVLQFELEVSDELAKNEDYGLAYVSFNDEWIEEDGIKQLYLSGANRNVIIDGEKYWLKGASESQITENIKNKNYTVHQLYFLPSDVINNKKEFTVTLDDVVVALDPDNEIYVEMDGKFEIEVSKEKALDNTKTFTNTDSAVEFKRLTNKVEKVSQTPMQTIIKVSSLTVDATLRNSTYLLAEDYIGDISYIIYDQDDNKLFVYSSICDYTVYYKDGTEKTYSISELDDIEFENCDKIFMNEYLVTEKDKDITSLLLEVYESNEYYGIFRNIGTHTIDLNKEKVVSKNVEVDDYFLENQEKLVIDDIEYFSLEIDDEYDISEAYYTSDVVYDDGYKYLAYEEGSKDNFGIVEYTFCLWGDSNKDFSVVLIKDKELVDLYIEENTDGDFYNVEVLEENEEFTLLAKINTDYSDFNMNHDIIKTIKLK